jgi:succinoglycan biosynthesis transport protein ExoP
MLNRSPLLENSPPEHDDEGGGPDLARLVLGFLRRNYLTIIISTSLTFAASFAVLKVVPPTYTAQVKVLLGSSKASALQSQSIVDDTPADIESQIEVLKSKAIATNVINQLNLTADPDFNRKSGPLYSAVTAVRQRLAITPQTFDADPMDELLDEFQKRLSASRIGMSNVIEVSYNAGNPNRAAVIANGIVKAYFDDQLKAKTDEHRTATAWLHDRLQELGNDALVAERAVNDLKTKSNIVSADGKLMDEAQVAALNTSLVAARTHTSDAMTRLNRFESILASSDGETFSLDNLDAAPGNSSGPAENALASASQSNNQILIYLRQQYIEYARREYEYSARYGNDHQAVTNLRAAMKSIRQTIFDEVRRLSKIARSDFEEAKQLQKEIERQLTDAISQSRNTNSAALSIRELETSAKGYRSLYESFLQRYMGTVQQGSFPITEARVISPATPPQKKTKPNTIVLLALGLFGGVALGVVLGIAREMMKRGFHTTAHVEERLHLRCLSVVPLLRNRKVARLTAKPVMLPGQADADAGQRTFSGRSGTSWVATAMPLSRFAESIRSIRLAIDLDSKPSSSKVVGLTSALPDEGKSTIAASLAQLLASSGKRVIVVDCDLRNPSLTATFAPDAQAGITDIVSANRSLEDTVWTNSETRFDFLPGRKELVSDATDLLCKEQTKKLFQKLRKTYDYVIVDLPPLAPVVDARAISALLDSFILVVEWGRTPADVVKHALNTAPNVHDALLGVVLNKTNMKAMKRYASHYGDYYNNAHYFRYGQLTAE